MIKDIPTCSEFDSAAKSQFDFAWDIVISFLLKLEEAKRYVQIDAENEVTFWESARQRILTSLIIAQQGVELAIKGKLASISPYLLISGNPSDWPKNNNETGVSFSDFRSIDAQDLIKVYNTVAASNLDNDFKELFDKSRKLRNKAMHAIDKALSVSAQEVIIMILEAHEHLYPSDNWVSTRRNFLSNSPGVHIFFDNDEIPGLVAREFLTVFEFLTKPQVAKFFKIDKNQRLYLCPECRNEISSYNDTANPKYAILNPNEPDSDLLYCFVCNNNHLVTRANCKSEECRGNVISVEYDCCCTCGEDQI